jgi:hypothetical protein
VRYLNAYVATLVLTGIALGAVFSPLRTLDAWRAGGRARPLFDRQKPRRLHSTAPAGA